MVDESVDLVYNFCISYSFGALRNEVKFHKTTFFKNSSYRDRTSCTKRNEKV